VLAGQFAIMVFVVLFLHDARGLSTSRAAIVLAAIQVGGAITRIAVGKLSDRTGRRIPLFVRVSALLAVSLAATAALVHASLVLLIPVLVVAGTLGMSWNGLSFTAAAEAAGARRSGAAIGFQQTILALAGLVIPIWFAALVSTASWRVAFFAAAGCTLAGALVLRRLSTL
jgi:MFS family permease